MINTDRGQLTGSAAEVYQELFLPAIFGRWPPVLLDAAAVASGQAVLDVGCGTGVLATAAVERVGADGRVVGLDPNPSMLAVARRRGQPVQWWSASAEAIPSPDGAFDRVVSQFALMFFVDRAKGLAEMARVTAPEGRVAVASWAALTECPGYSAFAEAVARSMGQRTADTIRAPFCLGDPAELGDIVAGSYVDVEVRRHPGTARFASIETMVRAEIRGWALSETIDQQQYERLVEAAEADLGHLTDAAGGIEFAMPALVATGHR